MCRLDQSRNAEPAIWMIRITMLKTNKMMSPFLSKLAGRLKEPVQDALLNYQLYNPTSPNEVQKLGNVFGSLIGKGPLNVSDDTGSFSVNPFTGQFNLMGKNFGIGVNANVFDPSAEVNFRFGKAAEPGSNPVMMSSFLNESMPTQSLSAGRAEMEEYLNRYKTNNPYYYRP